jgi:16S rRNA G966 N2-methylase RsmD
MSTVLGFLCNEHVSSIYCSDISKEAIELSLKNLSLLTLSGITNRKNELYEMVNKFDKESHKNALSSLEKITELLKNEIGYEVFEANILKKNVLVGRNFIADMVITDVPYSNLVNWSADNGNEINVLLDEIIPVINSNTIVAISHNKKQKITNQNFFVIEKMQTGHRKIELLKLKI